MSGDKAGGELPPTKRRRFKRTGPLTSPRAKRVQAAAAVKSGTTQRRTTGGGERSSNTRRNAQIAAVKLRTKAKELGARYTSNPEGDGPSYGCDAAANGRARGADGVGAAARAHVMLEGATVMKAALTAALAARASRRQPGAGGAPVARYKTPQTARKHWFRTQVQQPVKGTPRTRKPWVGVPGVNCGNVREGSSSEGEQSDEEDVSSSEDDEPPTNGLFGK